MAEIKPLPDLDLIAAAYDALAIEAPKILQQLFERLGSIEERVSHLEARQGAIEGRQEVAEGRQTVVEDRLDALGH